MKRLFERQFVQRGRPKLAQQLARGVMNAPGELAYLVRGGLGLRRIARPFDQLRLDLNRGDVLADFIVQLARQVFRVSSSVWISFRSAPAAPPALLPGDADSGAGFAPSAAGG